MVERLEAPENIAIFCDFENVAIGAHDAKLEAFDIQLVLARLLDKGKIVVKKAYADWQRYKDARRPLHEAGFELIEIPHVSYSGKNSADIRLVVDALDLCYTKSHVDLFAIISGDSDFSPLVSKLRENDKRVIGLGVRNSSSDLLIANCDEFIYYDELARTQKKSAREPREAHKPARHRGRKKAALEAEPAAALAEASAPEPGAAKSEALAMVVDTVEALLRDRADNVWGSMVKQTLKRKRPTFSESAHGYRNFNELLVDAEQRGLLRLQKDEKSGGYLILAAESEHGHQ